MPELPEVETIRRGLASLHGAVITDIEVRERRFRRPLDDAALLGLVGRRLEGIDRRAKYLLFRTGARGGFIVHLGMSGRLLLVRPDTPLAPHDHVSWWFERDGEAVELRFQDPRRFGVVVVSAESLGEHRLLAALGVEPLSDDFTAAAARAATRTSRRPIKNTLMDAGIVVGVGNIYASESLWLARINPKVRAGRISLRRWGRLRNAVVDVLERALADGGTTLNDFRASSGEPGYFQVQLRVYGKAGEPCPRCRRAIRRIVQSGRSTYYCAGCQH